MIQILIFLKRIFFQDIEARLVHASIGFIVFITAGYYIPRIYTLYFDRTDYISISQPILIEKDVYRQCDTITLIANTNSKINVTSKVSIQLIDVTEKELRPLDTFEGKYVFVEGKNLEIVEIDLSRFDSKCKRKPGIYLFRGIIEYEYKGATKTYFYITSTFHVLPKTYPLTEEEIILKDIKFKGGEKNEKNTNK